MSRPRAGGHPGVGTVRTEYVLAPDGTRIAFDRRGAGPVLVLVDGALSERRTGPMRPLAEHLAPRFTVVTYDRRGRGQSTDGTGPVRGYTVGHEVGDLRRLLEEVGAPGTGAALHGASTGALLALHAVAAGLPVRSVSLFEPPFGAGARLGGGFARTLTALLEEGRRAEVVRTFQRAVGVPEAVVAAGAAGFAASAQTLVYDCALTCALTRAVAARVGVPALVVRSAATGGRWPQAARDAVAALPRGELVALPAVWHGVPDADLAAVLSAFHRR